MPRNTSFQFKQFTVQQQGAAMKVCTDACVLGAWAEVESAGSILDIGTGTGLLSLMIAQRNAQTAIDAVEIDESAYRQAQENICDSPFFDRISLFHNAIQDFEAEGKYDCIVSNPPFFQSDLRSPKSQKNVAHHAETMTFGDLLMAVNRMLADEGVFHVLFPVSESVVFAQQAFESGLYMSRKLVLRHHEGKLPFRHIASYSKRNLNDNPLIAQELSVYEVDGKTYHPDFRALMKDFYLIF